MEKTHINLFSTLFILYFNGSRRKKWPSYYFYDDRQIPINNTPALLLHDY